MTPQIETLIQQIETETGISANTKTRVGNALRKISEQVDLAVPYTGATQNVSFNGKDLSEITNVEVDNSVKVGNSKIENSLWILGSDDPDPNIHLQLRPENGSAFTGTREQQFLDQNGFIPCSLIKGFTGQQLFMEDATTQKTMTFENGILISIT